MAQSIQERFVKCYQGEMLSTKEIEEWYSLNKGGGGLTYGPAVQGQLIRPLLLAGCLERLTRGFYRVGYWPEEAETEVRRPVKKQEIDVTSIKPVRNLTIEEGRLLAEKFEAELEAAAEKGAKAVVKLYFDKSWQDLKDGYEDFTDFCVNGYSPLREAASCLTKDEAEELGIDFSQLTEELGLLAAPKGSVEETWQEELVRKEKERLAQQAGPKEPWQVSSLHTERELPYVNVEVDFFSSNNIPGPPANASEEQIKDWWYDNLTEVQRKLVIDATERLVSLARLQARQADAALRPDEVKPGTTRQGRPTKAQREAQAEEQASLKLGLWFTKVSEGKDKE